MNIITIFLKIKALFKDNIYIFKEKIMCILYSKNKLSILFSEKPIWDSFLVNSFKWTNNKAYFNEFTAENIKKYDLVVPLTFSDLIKLVEMREVLQHNPIPIPTIESVRICNDKFIFNSMLIENGFEKYVPRMGKTLAFPYILKMKEGEYGRGTEIISSKEEEMLCLDMINSSKYFCQEIVNGKNEFATHIIFKDKKILCSMSNKYIFEVENFINGKTKYICREVTNCPYLDIFSSILLLIDFEGICCFDYKVVENRPLIFEINPRFGGSLTSYFFSFVRHLKK